MASGNLKIVTSYDSVQFCNNAINSPNTTACTPSASSSPSIPNNSSIPNHAFAVDIYSPLPKNHSEVSAKFTERVIPPGFFYY